MEKKKLYLLLIFVILLIIFYGIYKHGGIYNYFNYRIEKKQEKANKITNYIKKIS